MKKLYLLSIFLLSACNILPQSTEVTQRYVVSAPAMSEQQCTTTKTLALEIASPHAAPGLDSERVAVRKGVSLDYFADARWAETLPSLVQTQLVEAFDNTHCLKAVARDGGNVK